VTAAWSPATDVGAVSADDGLTVWVATLPGGPILVLDGVAATIWTEATRATGLPDLVARVCVVWGQEPRDVAADIEAFVDGLVSRGLLARARAVGG
jgi:hypothetical protein